MYLSKIEMIVRSRKNIFHDFLAFLPEIFNLSVEPRSSSSASNEWLDDSDENEGPETRFDGGKRT